MAVLSFLDKKRSIAPPGYSRWLIPPAALAIHLSIGQVYSFSVFKLPLTQAVGIAKRLPDQDWSQPQIAWIFSIAIVFLGLSAAVFGKWLEDNGPRKAMFASACCFGGGFLIASLGVHFHQLWLVYLGYGVVGGIGLGLGYISPVSTLIKWFIDRPGMATGMAIMGFGGGAMIGAPLATMLMNFFSFLTTNPWHSAMGVAFGQIDPKTLAAPLSVGVAPTMVVMGIAYFCFMMFGAFAIRVPAAGWAPAGYVPATKAHGMISATNVDVNSAFKTPQFWLLWIVLCANVTAGIGILEQASPMIQGIFKATDGSVSRVSAAAAAGFVGLLSLFNMGGRFFWSSVSDYIGRKATYCVFFIVGAALYMLLPHTGLNGLNSVPLFVAVACILLSMYGGGFATIPAYLRDMFGTMHVSAIHGRLLTAWSTAGVLGPLLVNYIADHERAANVAPSARYTTSMYVMACLLIVGLVCDLLVRAVSFDKTVENRQSDGTPVGARAVAVAKPTRV